MSTRNLLGLIIAASLAPWASGCTTLECGEGTHEADGVCLADDGSVPEVDSCGQDTHYDPVTMSCVPDLPPTICDPTTSVEQMDPVTGVITCIGTGVAGGCSGTFACSAPSSGRVSVCGQLINVDDNTLIRDPDADGSKCTTPTADGPCSLALTFYDAVGFANNGASEPPLDVGVIEIDNCGRFRGVDIEYPSSADFVGIGIDNASGVTKWALSGVALEVAPDLLERDVRSYVMTQEANTMWTDSAGCSAGACAPSFWERGVFVPLYMSGDPVVAEDPMNNVPRRVAGVTITSAGGPAAARDWYFSDTDANMLTTVDSGQAVTGANGAGLMVDSGLLMHSGTGAEPAGCIWPSNLAVSIDHVAFIQEKIAEPSGAEPCE